MSNVYFCACVCVCVQLFATPWTVAHQAPLYIVIFQTRILEWVAISSSRGSSRPKDWIHIFCVSCIAGRFFTTSTTWEVQEDVFIYYLKMSMSRMYIVTLLI